MNRKYIDFEVIKESWNKYSLQDGTILKARTVLESFWEEQTKGQRRYRAATDTRCVWLCDPSLQGKPGNTNYDLEQVKKNVEMESCPYTTLQYEPSEYRLDNGARIMFHYTLVNISRTSLFNVVGDRVYLVTASEQMNVIRSEN